MPELKSYTNDSPKSGYYILANVGGSHPVTIQVTDLGEQILQKAGYGAGDNIPTKIVWSMFDVGILYTSGTINDPPESVENPDETFRQLGVANKLTAQEQDQLLSYLDEYTGPNQAEVKDLRETLEDSVAATQDGSPMPEDVRDDLDRLSNLYERGDLMAQEYELLKSRILDDLPLNTASHENSSGTSDTDSWQEELSFDLAQALWDLVPKDKYENNHQQIYLNDRGTDDTFFMAIHYNVDEGGFRYNCSFKERSHEERTFELINDGPWELLSDNSGDSFSPSVTITHSATKGGFRDEYSRESVNDEVSRLLKLIRTVYRPDLSDLELDD